MNMKAHVVSRHASHTVHLQSGEREHSISMPPRPDGYGSMVNGGELLLMAVATCYCNDLYREAGRKGIAIDGVDVEVMGEYPGEGSPLNGIRYRATVTTQAPKEKVFELMTQVDSEAEIHNTLRQASEIVLTKCEVHSA
jgi:organic hydroperoxide reductase OsmC/OhrA